MRRVPRLVFLLVAALAFPACGGGGGGGGGPAAPASFTVVFRKPDSSPSVTPLQTEIYVRFNRDFQQSTVMTSTFSVSGGGGPVAGTFSYQHALFEIRFVPTAALSPSTLYTVTLDSGIQDLSGNPLVATAFTFTTGAPVDSTRPTFGGVTSASSPATTQVALVWTAATDASAVTYEVFFSLVSGVYDFTSPDYTSGSGTGMTVTGLGSNTTYFFVVRARDADGNSDLNTAEVTVKTLTSLATDVFSGIIQSQCRSCHISGGEAFLAGVTMDFNSAATLRTTTVNVAISATPLAGAPGGAMRVVPSSVAQSFLHNKVNSKRLGVAPWGGVGMPKTGSALSQADVDTISAWIAEGALSN